MERKKKKKDENKEKNNKKERKGRIPGRRSKGSENGKERRQTE